MRHSKLNVVFICSSLEPGHDGVGDYTRRLAAALNKAGHSCAILSLNDRHITGEVAQLQHADDMDVPVMRLSAGIEINHRFERAKAWINEFDPQWLSLQFVPFGYHPKGLKLGLGSLLASLSHTANWHIMFHELWVGIAREESVKLKIWGLAQRFLTKSLVRKLAPKLVHTQTHLYQALLARIGVNAAYLPLFGNIPVIRQSCQNSSEGRILLVVFGAIHNRAPITQFAQEAAAYANRSGIQISLKILGRGNSEQQRWAGAFKKNSLDVELLGEQPTERISEILSAATFGLSATALAVIEKSGSYAAMREHGLPVISVAKPWTPAGVAQPIVPEGVLKFQPGNFEACITGNGFIVDHNNVHAVSSKFAEALLSIKTS